MKKLIFGIAIAFTASFSFAGNLTQEQKNTLNSDVDTHAELTTFIINKDIPAIADYYNALSYPSYIVWRTSVLKDEFTQAAGFDFSRVDNLTVGKARIWDYLFDNNLKSINCSKTNVQAGIDAAWVGTAADLAVRTVVKDTCKRDGKRIEKLFSTGTGTTASPAVMSFEGNISHADVISALYNADGSRR